MYKSRRKLGPNFKISTGPPNCLGRSWSSIHMDFNIFWLTSSNLVSWINTIQGSWWFSNFRRELLFIFPPIHECSKRARSFYLIVMIMGRETLARSLRVGFLLTKYLVNSIAQDKISLKTKFGPSVFSARSMIVDDVMSTEESVDGGEGLAWLGFKRVRSKFQAFFFFSLLSFFSHDNVWCLEVYWIQSPEKREGRRRTILMRLMSLKDWARP